MPRLRVATWNINSLRLRFGLLDRLVESLSPDVICLQETKVPDLLFPAEALAPLAYPHTVFRGMKGYNGVAILSRIPLEVHDLAPDWCETAFVDAVRHFVPPDQKLYSWWSYRNQNWRASDRGRRLDHIWVTPDLEQGLRSQTILRDARDWPRGSDHVPVCVEVDV